VVLTPRNRSISALEKSHLRQTDRQTDRNPVDKFMYKKCKSFIRYGYFLRAALISSTVAFPWALASFSEFSRSKKIENDHDKEVYRIVNAVDQ
jgi:hypothetical protein